MQHTGDYQEVGHLQQRHTSHCQLVVHCLFRPEVIAQKFLHVVCRKNPAHRTGLLCLGCCVLTG